MKLLQKLPAGGLWAYYICFDSEEEARYFLFERPRYIQVPRSCGYADAPNPPPSPVHEEKSQDQSDEYKGLGSLVDYEWF